MVFCNSLLCVFTLLTSEMHLQWQYSINKSMYVGYVNRSCSLFYWLWMITSHASNCPVSTNLKHWHYWLRMSIIFLYWYNWPTNNNFLQWYNLVVNGSFWHWYNRPMNKSCDDFCEQSPAWSWRRIESLDKDRLCPERGSSLCLQEPGSTRKRTWSGKSWRPQKLPLSG